LKSLPAHLKEENPSEKKDREALDQKVGEEAEIGEETEGVDRWVEEIAGNALAIECLVETINLGIGTETETEIEIGTSIEVEKIAMRLPSTMTMMIVSIDATTNNPNDSSSVS
jgi:hypothetical protein